MSASLNSRLSPFLPCAVNFGYTARMQPVRTIAKPTNAASFVSRRTYDSTGSARARGSVAVSISSRSLTPEPERFPAERLSAALPCSRSEVSPSMSFTSLQYMKRSAKTAPICIIASRSICPSPPGILKRSRSTDRCPEPEIGRNSPAPPTKPCIIASSTDKGNISFLKSNCSTE